MKIRDLIYSHDFDINCDVIVEKYDWDTDISEIVYNSAEYYYIPEEILDEEIVLIEIREVDGLMCLVLGYTYYKEV